MLRAGGVSQLGTGRGLLGGKLGGLLAVAGQVAGQVGRSAVSELHNYFKSRNEIQIDKMDLVHCDN